MTASSRANRALITDFGGVVSTSFAGALRSFCVREGLAPDALERVFSLDGGAKGQLAQLERGLITQSMFVGYLAPLLGVRPERLLQRILADLHLEPAVVDTVARIRAAGIAVAVLSNSWGTDPDAPFDPYLSFGLDDKFDVIVLSHEIGIRKPEPGIFTHTAARLRVPPSNCVFIDDVEHYLTPAGELGMHTIHATDPRTTVKELLDAFPAA